MSGAELEAHFLVPEDPLACTKEDFKTEDDSEGWMRLDSDIVPEDSGPRLRVRKQGKIDVSEAECSSDSEWEPKSLKNESKWRRSSKDPDGGFSDEENIIPGDARPEELSTENNLQCGSCEKAFVTPSELEEHVSDSFRCGDSSVVLTEGMASHVGVVQVEEGKSGQRSSNATSEKNGRCRKYYEQLKTERKYQCEVCKKTFITSGHLNTHMYRHSGKKWTCEGCGKDFSCERSLIRHRDTFPGEHSFPCKYCDVTFFRAANIAKHIEIKHPEALVDGNLEEERTCKECSKTFVNTEEFAAHRSSAHSDSQTRAEENQSESNHNAKYKCEVCAKEFVSLEGFEYHRTHQHVEKDAKKKKKRGKMAEGCEEVPDEDDDEPPRANFVCRICSAAFSMKSMLQSHLKSHNVTKNMEVKSGSHQCCICPRSFTSSDGLKYHLATHTGERRYSCGQCGKRFIKKTHLSEHIATHSEVKYFKCPRCPRTFSTHSAYRKHMKHFPGPHSFPCSKCGKLFTKESMIEKHMCVDLVKITMAPEVKALLSEDMIEEYICLAEEQMAEEKRRTEDNTSHSCYKCFKVFPSLSSLQAHQNDHIGKQNYQCRFCPESFKRADAFSAHIRNHLGSTPYMCLKCNRKFISPFTLSMHAKNYPGDHSFTCQKCQRWFPSEKRLEKHECILQNADHFKCACGSSFANWNELLRHAGTKPYKCCSCELKYPTLMALARHIKKHTGVKPFTCEVCGKSFRAKNNYLNHKNIHRNAKEIQCEYCEYKSKSQKRMDFHLFRKHDIGSNVAKSTLCPICGVIFPYISQMKKHVELEHGNEMILEESPGEKKTLPAELCTLCGKMLNNKYTLANHMKKVHDPNAAKKERNIKCEFCDEKFHTMKKLQRHAEVHEVSGLRKCDICEKEFYFAKDLRKHMRKHDTNKPFSCSRCGKHFKVSVSLKYHSTICGNVGQRTSNGRAKKKEPKEQSVDVLYGHINPMDLNNQPYMVQIYGR